MLGRLPRFGFAQRWPILGECAAVSLEALRRYKLRTALSTLGVILGISAVVAMMSVADGARREALRQVESMGLGNIVVRSRALPLSEARPGRNGLTLRDVEKLPSMVPLVSKRCLASRRSASSAAALWYRSSGILARSLITRAESASGMWGAACAGGSGSLARCR